VRLHLAGIVEEDELAVEFALVRSDRAVGLRVEVDDLSGRIEPEPTLWDTK
jgi:hypothetical protein